MDRALSSTVAVVVLVGMTITAAGLTVALGATAIDGTTQTTELSRAEHAMTLFDARTAMVGLGETGGQSVTLGRASGGTYEASPDTGRIVITHHNYSPGEDRPIYEQSLGEVTYTNGDTVVAYQGGGVWRRTGNGTTMVSPPEFHYRDATLTLPVIRVTSADASGGPSSAFVKRDSEPLRVYPNATRHNPIRNGTVSVSVQSNYYQGWADYFSERTTGNVTVNHSTETATVVLQTVGEVGSFALPSKGDGVEVRGKASGHSVDQFAVDIAQSGGSFNNMKFSFYAEREGHKYEVLVRVDKDRGNCDIKSSDTLTMWVLYDDPDDGKPKHAWMNDDISADSGPIRLECDGKDTRIVVDYLTDDTSLQMTNDASLPSKTGLAWDESSADSVSFNHSADRIDGENKTHTAGESTETVGNLSRHYLTEMGSDFELKVYHGGGSSGTAHVDGSGSSGALYYDTSTGSRYITYLHVTENNVSVRFR